MAHFKNVVLVVAGVLALTGCARSGPPATDAATDAAADEAAIRAAGAAWFTAYTAGDVDALAALYADDAVVSVPGAPAARGSAAVREALAKDVAASSGGGFILAQAQQSDVGSSGDLGWEWNTFNVSDKSGAKVDAGKYLTLFERRDGKWLIIRDIWNSDNAPAPPATPAAN